MRDDDNLSKPLHSMSLRDTAAHNSYTHHDLHRMRLLDILDTDSRPTLILTSRHLSMHTVYFNPHTAHCSPSLLASEVLLNLIVGKIDVGTVGAFSIRPYSRFKQWLAKKGDGPNETTRGSPYMFEGFSWSPTTIGNRWKTPSGYRVFLLQPKISAGFCKGIWPGGQPSEHNIEQGAEKRCMLQVRCKTPS